MSQEKIQRAVWNLKECIKDVTDKSLTESYNKKLLSSNLTNEQIQEVLLVVKTAIDEGFNVGIRTMLKVADDVINVESAKIAKNLLKR